MLIPVVRLTSKLAEVHVGGERAVAAEVKRGELMGYYIDRKESTNVTYTITNQPLSAEEWTAKYCVPAGQKH